MKTKTVLIIAVALATSIWIAAPLQSMYYDFFIYPDKGYIIEKSGVRYTYVATINEGVWRKRRLIPIPGADPETFRILEGHNNGHLVAVDKNFAYFERKKVEKSHGPTFEMIRSGFEHGLDGSYWKDKDSVFRGGKHLEGSDPKTFKVIVFGNFAKDKNQIYAGDTVIKPCDIDSFRFIGPDEFRERYPSPWWRDDFCIYKDSFKIEFADINSFETLNLNFARDKYSIISGIGRPHRIQDVDLNTFKAYNQHYGQDKISCYYRGRLETCPEKK